MAKYRRNRSVLNQQCLERRIRSVRGSVASANPILEQELRAWQDERNASQAKVHWRFSTADTRIKLHHLYPQF
ncbi:hypothetical protein [Okeania hirsuta]|uniref:hypothetical protein n=1 Tax=Okeania TaxID=1458928 RepID=UPI000F525EC5|nr:hypothetical protein [Okeania sp. SIO4D6]NEP71108.1 hypothetical protein [Okeania sp. SIO2G5]NEP97374.1 hypothetical protein [Okeania sp. SIO2F5]NEQ90137.1 hypothetical protein [Okeania sp. SIO2G4]NES78211.1 hypothetical protein [Okeania sp. SIO1H4]NES89225.1 hypothetical protein [Okeania sp. SIO2B9]NET11502.1 hypothetical protein [Okeania sp. SIO1H6]NET18727.1 hypothetical protein [Okeania sp. SIO1H5]NET78360.1 hypothetical protein [Okeania sp. SIO1F9]NET93233.1 hypothetical protein [O